MVIQVVPFDEGASVTPAAAGRRKKAPDGLLGPSGANGKPGFA
jgi:hypothetical protein